MIQSRHLGMAVVIYLGVAGLLPLAFDALDPFGWWAGTALGILGPTLHWIATRRVLRLQGELFHSSFYLSILIRTVVVLGIFVALLVGTEIGKITFTLSFIISYIFHSVIDIILIQQSEFNGRSNS